MEIRLKQALEEFSACHCKYRCKFTDPFGLEFTKEQVDELMLLYIMTLEHSSSLFALRNVIAPHRYP